MKFKNLLQKWWEPRKTWKYQSVKIITSMQDVPIGNLDKNIYLINKNGKNKWVIFDCPKGHGKRIEINLMKSILPFWNIDIKKNTISLSPSVAILDDKCDCHFWLKRNIAYEAFSWKK